MPLLSPQLLFMKSFADARIPATLSTNRAFSIVNRDPFDVLTRTWKRPPRPRARRIDSSVPHLSQRGSSSALASMIHSPHERQPSGAADRRRPRPGVWASRCAGDVAHGRWRQSQHRQAGSEVTAAPFGPRVMNDALPERDRRQARIVNLMRAAGFWSWPVEVDAFATARREALGDSVALR